MEERALKIVGKTPLEAATTIVEDYELPCGVDENNSDVCHLLLFLLFLKFLVLPGANRLIRHLKGRGMSCLWHWLLILQGLILSPKSLIMKVCNTFYEMFTQLRKILYFLLYKKKLNLLVFKVLIYRLKNIKKLYNYFLFIFYFMMF